MPSPSSRSPARPGIMRMRWVDLLFAHWPIDPDAIRPLIPNGLELDTFEGRAYLGMVPFRMEDVGPRGLPAPPIIGAFPELNVRTYVRHGGRDGVWFLSLDATSRVAVEGARAGFHLPYFLADMELRREREVIEYRSRRRDPRGPGAALDIRYRPTRAGGARRGRVPRGVADGPDARVRDRSPRPDRAHRDRAPAVALQPASAWTRDESMVSAHGLVLPDEPPHLRYAARLDVRGWWPRPA